MIFFILLLRQSVLHRCCHFLCTSNYEKLCSCNCHLQSIKNSEKIHKVDVIFTGSSETLEEIEKSVVYFGKEDVYVGGDIIILKLNSNTYPFFMSFISNYTK